MGFKSTLIRHPHPMQEIDNKKKKERRHVRNLYASLRVSAPYFISSGSVSVSGIECPDQIHRAPGKPGPEGRHHDFVALLELMLELIETKRD